MNIDDEVYNLSCSCKTCTAKIYMTYVTYWLATNEDNKLKRTTLILFHIGPVETDNKIKLLPVGCKAHQKQNKNQVMQFNIA